MSARPVHLLRNFGPKSARLLAEIDVTTEDELRAAGAAAVFRRLQHVNPRGVSLNMLWALAGAVEDRDWRSFSAAEKAALKRAAGLDA